MWYLVSLSIVVLFLKQEKNAILNFFSAEDAEMNLETEGWQI